VRELLGPHPLVLIWSLRPRRDTVDSVGVVPRRLPFTTSNTIVRTFRQALSLDERRASFKANVWNYPTDEEAKLGLPACRRPPSIPLPKRKQMSDTEAIDYDGNEEMEAAEQRYSSTPKHPTDVYEVWFSGCHCGTRAFFPCLFQQTDFN
jgi:uncharacterized protein (DUF2235 family)